MPEKYFNGKSHGHRKSIGSMALWNVLRNCITSASEVDALYSFVKTEKMRILWIAPSGGRFDLESQKGGGWISSLEKALVETYPDIELGIAFLSENYSEPVGRDNVTYFPVFKPPVGKCKRLWNRLRRRTEEEVLLKGFEKVANAYNPDLLQIWGAEHFHIKLAKSLKYPQVVHIQGFASVISHYYLPFGVSVNDLKKCDGIINRILKRGYSYNSSLTFSQG